MSESPTTDQIDIAELTSRIDELKKQISLLNSSSAGNTVQVEEVEPPYPTANELYGAYDGFEQTKAFPFWVSATFIFFLYINIRLIYILPISYKRDSSTKYYPVTLIISILHLIAISTLFVQSAVGMEIDGSVYFTPRIVVYLIFMSLFYAYPLCLMLLITLLCVHRTSCIFGISNAWLTEKFKLFGPFFFLSLVPIITIIVALSNAHKKSLSGFFGFIYKMDIDYDFYFYGYLVDTVLNILLTAFSICGFLIILRTLYLKKIPNPGEDIVILKQVFPIAIFQLVCVLIGISCDAQFLMCTSSKTRRLFFDMLMFGAATMFVPVCVIFGNPNNRRVWKNSRCCCRKKKAAIRSTDNTYEA